MAAARRTTLLVLGALLGTSPAAADATRAAQGDPLPHRSSVHARRDRAHRPAAATIGVAAAPGLILETPFTLVAGMPDVAVRVPHYIGPDGTYDEYADLVRSINGTPCGQDCTGRSLQRWGYGPVDRSALR